MFVWEKWKGGVSALPMTIADKEQNPSTHHAYSQDRHINYTDRPITEEGTSS